MKKFMLVLQWPATSIEEFDRLVGVEIYLHEHLSGLGVVDGHDAGSGEMNIFVYCDDAVSAFEKIKELVASRFALQSLRAAYRESNGNRYTVLWPKNLTKFSVA